MISTTSSSPVSRQSTPESSGGHADPRKARSFRALMEDDTPPPDSAVPVLPPLPPPLLTSGALAELSRAGAVTPRPTATGDSPLSPPRVSSLDAQTLELRVSQGPLAGLLVHASLQGSRLGLRLGAPPSALAERLQRGRGPLAATLSAALGVDVVVEVHDEH